ncbi:hypothetical protein A3860_35130 [Niastella vici]|uniref:DUF4369 domain-containing protein n=1 Tax=Niastella vici TaxID=1703345 RepID=A0A1V9FNX1_9BACT|nr:hypothetical protein [Niastella vici]OQP60007.1 hypothetical protein A3860_35130 [Niastella vici]
MRLILSTLLLFAAVQSIAQNELKGKWYCFSFKIYKVIEYSFDSTNVVMGMLDWDLTKQPVTDPARIIRIVKNRGNLYYLIKGGQDTSVVSLLLFSSVKSDSSFVLSTTSDGHTNYDELVDALAFIQADTLQRPGLIFYSEKQLHRFKTLRGVSTITKENYKKYLLGLIQARQEFEKFASNSNSDFGPMFFAGYLPNQARKVLVSLGYNPLIDDEHLFRIDEKFKDDKSLKELRDKALKFE